MESAASVTPNHSSIVTNKRKHYENHSVCKKKRKTDTNESSQQKLFVCVGNCVSRKRLEGSVIDRLHKKYNYADPYSQRGEGSYPNLAAVSDRATLGSIEVRMPPDNQTDKPIVAILYSQYRMGSTSSGYYMNSCNIDEDYKTMSLEKDSLRHRRQNFTDALETLLSILPEDNFKNVTEITIPILYKLQFLPYQDIINDFKSKVEKKFPKFINKIQQKYINKLE